MGVFLYDTLIKAFPEQHSITVINQSLLLYFAGELVLRFLLQSLPIREVKPLLVLPVPKAKIVRGVMMHCAFGKRSDSKRYSYRTFNITGIRGLFFKIPLIGDTKIPFFKLLTY